MALPDNITTVWLRVRHMVELNGDYATGQRVYVKPSFQGALINQDAHAIIGPATFIGEIDQDGHVAIEVPATDDPDVNPTGFTYRVTEPWRTYDMVVPYDTPILGDDPGDDETDPLYGQRVIELDLMQPAAEPSPGFVQLVEGPAGPPTTLAIGTVETGDPDDPASATITGDAPNQTLNLVLPQGVQGTGLLLVGSVDMYTDLPVDFTEADAGKAMIVVDTGLLYVWDGVQWPDAADGAQLPVNELQVGTVATSAPGSPAEATISGAPPLQSLNLTLPRGNPGPANELTIGSVTTGAPGTDANAEITGTPPEQTVSFTLPEGQQGAQGEQGPAGPPNALTVGTVGTGPADAEIVGTPPNQTLNLTVPQGVQGEQGVQGVQGEQGAANELTVGAVTTENPGDPATATITGTAPDQVLNLGIPKGDAGPVTDLTVGTVTTVDYPGEAEFELTGTAPTKTVNVTLPRGPAGSAGTHDHDDDIAAAITAHEAETDPHPTYLTQAEGDARYVQPDALGIYATETALTDGLATKADTSHDHDGTYQPLDADLTSIAGLAPADNDIVQRKSGAWTNRTPTQLKTDLALTKGDVGLGSVDNTADTAKPVSSATQTALDAKAPLASPTFSGTATFVRVVNTPATLTDGTSIATNAAAGNHFRVTMSSSQPGRTLAAPTNAADGQRALWQFRATGAAYQFELATGTGGFERLSTVATGPYTVGSGHTLYLGAVYDSARSRWTVLALDNTG